MPSLSVSSEILFKSLDVSSEKDLENYLFDFGIEVDNIYEENGVKKFKLDIAANRYDLLCNSGLIMALECFINNKIYEDIQIKPYSIEVKQYESEERNHVACAIVHNIRFDKDTYDDFIKYQDKLHGSLGRNRSLMSMGTHDFNKIEGNIVYRSMEPSEIEFCPLNGKRSVKGNEIREYFSEDKQLGKYCELIGKDMMVFQDEKGIMSLPPIINSERTKIGLETTSVFVEVTGTNFNKINTALKLILYNFRGERVEAVKIKKYKKKCVENADEKFIEEIITPVMNRKIYLINKEMVYKKLNTIISIENIKTMLERMMYKVNIKEEILEIQTVDARSDILHECDIIEDVAIAYGFNNFVKNVPSFYTVGSENLLNKFSDKIRNEIALMGFNEILSLTLLSKEENIIMSEKQVVLSNPKSKEYEVVRTSLIPGLLKSISCNLHNKIPIKIFEVSDVVFLSEQTDEGAINRKHLGACVAGNRSMLEELQGPVTFLFNKIGIMEVKYVHCNKLQYLENQSAEIKANGIIVGSIGVLKPQICNDFKIPYAASTVEIDIEKVFEIYKFEGLVKN